jgi:hypothetical protein
LRSLTLERTVSWWQGAYTWPDQHNVLTCQFHIPRIGGSLVWKPRGLQQNSTSACEISPVDSAVQFENYHMHRIYSNRIIRDYYWRPVSRRGNNGALIVTCEQVMASRIPAENNVVFVNGMVAARFVETLPANCYITRV